MNNELMFSRKSDEWQTPKDLFERLDQLYNFTLDPCATEDNRMCDKYYTVEIDGLKQSWEGERVFVNPPYSQMKKWVMKSYEESKKENTLVVMLIPARTDTKVFHDIIMKYADRIAFVRGRLKFINEDIVKTSPAPFPSMIVVFGESKDKSEDELIFQSWEQ